MNLIDADKLAYEDIESVDGKTYMVVHEPEIRLAPSAFEEMTNGEILEALFPSEGSWKDVDFVEFVFRGETHTTYFTREWWDSPYKGVSE